MDTPQPPAPEGAPIEAPQADPVHEALKDDHPAIATWKTSVGFSILGVLAFAWIYLPIAYLIADYVSELLADWFEVALFASPDLAFAGMGIATLLVMALFSAPGIIYAALVYTSLFTDKPKLLSSKAISFCNLLFGGIVFGCIWNHNLTITRGSAATGELRVFKGISYIVYIVLIALSLCLNGVKWFAIDAPSMQYDLMLYAQDQDYLYGDDDNGLKDSMNATRMTDDEFGVSFLVPNDWEQSDVNETRQFIRWKAYPIGTTDVGIIYGASFLPEGSPESIFDYSEEDFTGIMQGVLQNCADESIEMGAIGETAYFRITGSGDIQLHAQSVHVNAVVFMTIQDGIIYNYQYFDASDGSNTAQCFEQFQELVASAYYF